MGNKADDLIPIWFPTSQDLTMDELSALNRDEAKVVSVVLDKHDSSGSAFC